MIRRSICSAEAELKVKVTSKSFIKPSSPTPPNLRNFNLSLLDQFFPNAPVYPTFLFFYPPPAGSPTRLLRDSLSKTLSHFYPFAGRIKATKQDGTSISTINCNDQGAEYLEAEANQEMIHFLSSSPPNTQLLRRLAPPRPQVLSVDMPLACVQTTLFRCGGMAVGVSLNHLIADGHAFSMLINHWASVARGDHILSTTVDMYAHDMAASLFPINDTVLNCKPLAWRKPVELSNKVEMPATILQRFVFKGMELSALKSRVKSSQVPNPSRTLAIFGLIWKTAMKAYALSSQSETTSYTALSLVSLRPRFKTPLPDYSMGNLLWSTETKVRHRDILVEMSLSSDDSDELKRLVYQLKRSIDKVDTEFVENLKGEKGHNEVRKFLEARGLHGKDYFFSSVLRSELNEVDFGRGKPIWVSFVSPTDFPVPDSVVLVEATRSNDGTVEAWVSLTEKEMVIFERDPQLLQYAAVNPRVL
ncbi:Salutaridinol 7-O-acetyltransferase [Linum grandiflorum]